MGRTTLSKLAAICLVSSTVPPATALSTAVNVAQAMGLFSRDSNSCSVSGYTPCNHAGLPADFCCLSSTTTCIAFNNSTSAICCPSGSDCKQIQPLSCDITQQNSTLHPQNPLHSTQLAGTLQPCGGFCCPQGFSCQNGLCIMDDQNDSSSTTSASSTASNSAATTLKSAPNISTTVPSTAASNPAATQSPTPQIKCNAFPANAIVAGFFSGLLTGGFLAFLIILCIRRRRDAKSRRSGDFGRVSATVSDPIYQPQDACRTDFLRRESRSRQRSSTVRSLFSRSSSMRHQDGIGRSFRTSPRTPENKIIRREPSMESIRIYSPPDAYFRPQTTFTDMMETAGFRKDEPYLGSPARVDPRARGASGIGNM
ncbi:MAG: hypothetical protein FRX48_08692 [Lasallia pustulata]|uniref:Uncharacterized protein n=1 Tax=Lasallia pustulata TaxID=136370 RepID=A0A5M8PDP0_9LECA|nr:MAG: hypothetical protein FRX48_08692 [Lasallia pustulata]